MNLIRCPVLAEGTINAIMINQTLRLKSFLSRQRIIRSATPPTISSWPYRPSITWSSACCTMSQVFLKAPVVFGPT